MSLDGAVGAALVDRQSGMTLGAAGGGPILNLDVAAAGNTGEVRAKLKVIQNLGLEVKIEDIPVTLTSRYHLIRLLERDEGLFVYLVFGKEQSNVKPPGVFAPRVSCRFTPAGRGRGRL